MSARRTDDIRAHRSLRRPSATSERRIIESESFQKMIAFERKRSERSGKSCLLFTLAAGNGVASATNAKMLGSVIQSLSLLVRETDVVGWYRQSAIVGAIITDIGSEERTNVISVFMGRVTKTLQRILTLEEFSQVTLSFHSYPENWIHELARRPSDPILYPDLEQRDESRRVQRIIKRGMDIIGSVAGLILLSPVLLLIAIAIKLTSRGPVLFKQERIGHLGRPFVFLKFRSMYVNNDVGMHKEWFQNFYSGKQRRHPTGDGEAGTFKLPNDPRITRLGRLLRRTSLDELPQLLNVLRGEMSLVGPRPPIPYEVDAYQTWQRGRILQAKPGITGLWQVSGRSRVSFEEWVRLDLRYSRTWSIWLDLKILLSTPRAVIFGEGAY